MEAQSQMNKLDNPNRRQLLPAAEMLRAIGLASGDHIADIGCGTGFFTLPAAAIVGEAGTVYAVDVSAGMLAETKKRAEAEGFANVVYVKSDGVNIPMENSIVSTAFFCTVLHEVSDLMAVLAEAKRILVKDGHLCVVEWDQRTKDFGPPDKHRLEKTVLMKAVAEAGFSDIALGSHGAYFYTLTARKT